jgi:predicted Fe-Mo cluster-binding NifX family protein
MKIAFTAKENTLDSQIDERFGRARYFLIYDLEKEDYDFIENKQALDSPSGAGIQAAQIILDQGVSALVTGHCGPKAYKALEAANISIYVQARGEIKDVIQAYKQGKLKKANAPDVEGHWE